MTERITFITEYYNLLKDLGFNTDSIIIIFLVSIYYFSTTRKFKDIRGKLDYIASRITKLEKRIGILEHCMIELQTFLKTKFKAKFDNAMGSGMLLSDRSIDDRID